MIYRNGKVNRLPRRADDNGSRMTSKFSKKINHLIKDVRLVKRVN